MQWQAETKEEALPKCHPLETICLAKTPLVEDYGLNTPLYHQIETTPLRASLVLLIKSSPFSIPPTRRIALDLEMKGVHQESFPYSLALLKTGLSSR